MKIVFWDDATPREYSFSSLNTSGNGVGGTEATVIRLAVALAKRNSVTVVQKKRANGNQEIAANVTWASRYDGRQQIADADVVVVLRRAFDVIKVRRYNKRANVIVWYHDWVFPSKDRDSILARVRDRGRFDLKILIHLFFRASAVAVSRTHLQNLRDSFRSALILGRQIDQIKWHFIYNPVEMPDKPIKVKYDKNKLIFFSAPWKGLAQVLRNFRYIRSKIPELSLHLASPGYDQIAADGDLSGIEIMGNLGRDELLNEVASSLCVFYPADLVPETFGLVFAESHMVGTPVLAHRFGSAVELLSENELVDVKDVEAVLDKVTSWRNGERPSVSYNSSFAMSEVIADWERVF